MELGAACGERAADAVLRGGFLAHPAQRLAVLPRQDLEPACAGGVSAARAASVEEGAGTARAAA